MLTEKQILDFQKIYKEKLGKDISKKEALEKGLKLINLMEIIMDSSINRIDSQVVIPEDLK
ncbi:MAG: hypothetical protein ACYDIA_02420 [Candidatus Humimicrobiaceae bacterium]